MDILGVLEALPASPPYDPKTGKRVLVLAGDQRPGKKLVAKTACEITFSDEAPVQECIRALKDSDEELRARPNEHIFYEWSRVYREGMTIIFGVLWYDRAFFERRKDAYLSSKHVPIFSKFGASAGTFKIEHEILE